jgi:hypothetical protein
MTNSFDDRQLALQCATEIVKAQLAAGKTNYDDVLELAKKMYEFIN